VSILDLTNLSYSRSAYDVDPAELIANAETQLYGHRVDFDSMVGVGLSGLLVLPLLARHFDVPFFGCRKRNEPSHNSLLPQGGGRIGQKWILIDDAKVTGNTVAKVQRTISLVTRKHNFKTTYKGAYFYNSYANTPGAFQGPEDDAKQSSLQRYTDDAGNVKYIPSDMYFRIKSVFDVYAPDRTCVVDKTMEHFRRTDYRGWGHDQVLKIVEHLDRVAS